MKLRIEKPIYGGAGLARIPAADAAGPAPRHEPGNDRAAVMRKAVFIPNTLPGELVEARLTGGGRGFSTASLDAVLEPSAERIAPGCEYSPACGGCQYQHAAAEYQLRMKLDILRETLERARLPALSRVDSRQAPPWAYRNRIRLQCTRREALPARAREGPKIVLGYRERGSHTLLPVEHCPIAAPILDRAIAAVLRPEMETGLLSACHEIEFFTNGDQDALLLSLWTAPGARLTSETARSLESFAESLRAHLSALAGVGLFSPGAGEDRLIAHWGRRSLTYKVSGRSYRVGMGSFFQANRYLIPDLLELAVASAAAASPSLGAAWDLYAGVGLFAKALAFENVTAVESNSFSAADLRHNLAGAPHRAVRSSVLGFLRAQTRGRAQTRPDLILLDPPRSGLGAEVCACLAEIAAPVLGYVSCDPATLARDLQALVQSGYRLRDLCLVDMFPQTFHLETVALLVRW